MRFRSKEGLAIYNIEIRDIFFNAPYEIGFEYDLPEYTTVRYDENYHFTSLWFVEASELMKTT